MNKSALIPKLFPKILMVCTEYPPMHGGVGRYTYNLTAALRRIGYDVIVASNEMGDSDFSGLSPKHNDDSNLLLHLVDNIKPDIVHVQYEQGMYGLVLNGLDPRKTHTNIDSFYNDCKVPIVTTFHSGYTIKQWLDLSESTRSFQKPKFFSHNIFSTYWTSLLNYYSFHNLNKDKLAKSKFGIVFSNHMSKIVGGGRVVLHGAEPFLPTRKGKEEAREVFNLPKNKRIALAMGFINSTKGWDILEKINVPSGWCIVINSSYNHYSTKLPSRNVEKNGIIDLHLDYLSEEDLSTLFASADAVVLPYKVCSGSGVMFDALAHGLPFVASNLEFFKEFSTKGLGIVVNRNSTAFAKGLEILDREYDFYKHEVENFRSNINWEKIAHEHSEIYSQVLIGEAAIIAAPITK